MAHAEAIADLLSDYQALLIGGDSLVEATLNSIRGAKGTKRPGLPRPVADLLEKLNAPLETAGGLLILSTVPQNVAQVVKHPAFSAMVASSFGGLQPLLASVLPVLPILSQVEEVEQALRKLPGKSVQTALGGLAGCCDEIGPFGLKPLKSSRVALERRFTIDALKLRWLQWFGGLTNALQIPTNCSLHRGHQCLLILFILCALPCE